MSLQDLKAYGKRAATDPAVRAKAKSIGLQNVKGQAEYAKTLGYTFDQSDMDALAKETQPKGELSEKELSKVAGGIVTTTGALVGAAVVSAGAAVVGTAAAATAASSSGGW